MPDRLNDRFANSRVNQRLNPKDQVALPPERRVLSVSDLNRQARMTIEQRFNQTWVSGELSSLAKPGSGHWYFTLKDNAAQVRCAMFANANRRARIQPANGQQVLIRGRVSLYEGRGEFQIIVEHIEPAGEGALRAAFDALKHQLDAEGLFAAERKKELPVMPRRVAVVTSPTGAALKDVLAVWRRRYPVLEVVVVPTAVQGAEAENHIINALERAEALHPDVILLTRGGGSMEDLWIFNAESIARTIAQIHVPVVSAIGHEIDVAMTDFVADVRAPTPSAAAELIAPDGDELQQILRAQLRRLSLVLSANLRERQLSLEKLALGLVSPSRYCQQAAQRLDDLHGRLLRTTANTLDAQNAQRSALNLRLVAQRPDRKITALRHRLNETHNLLKNAVISKVQARQQRLGASARMLESLSPLPTLIRGYTILRDESGNVLSEISQLNVNQEIHGQMQDGKFSAKILQTQPGETLAPAMSEPLDKAMD